MMRSNAVISVINVLLWHGFDGQLIASANGYKRRELAV
jgi:hypothetical protein